MSKEYWLEQFEERAGILEFDAGFNRSKANRLSYLEIRHLLLQDRFSKQNEYKDFNEFKAIDARMVEKTMYSWGIKLGQL